MKHLLVILLSLTLFSCYEHPKQYVKMQGMIFGTTYNIIYQPVDEDTTLHTGVVDALLMVNASMSTFVDTSTISKFNYSKKGIYIDTLMQRVFSASKIIYEQTNGAFDITVAPLVNAWGFGFTKRDSITPALIDSLLQNIGMDLVKLENGFLHKSKEGVMLDASSIAKGFGVDVAADYLASKGINNYMVEIGGEIRASGVSNKNIPWRIGIDKPTDDKSALNRELQDILSLNNVALATSGNYRNFYILNEKKYAHTISPQTGYPIQHSLLSASIIAPNCMIADAYATACMVMGLERSFELISELTNVEGYFIYTDQDGKTKIKYTDGFEELIARNKPN